VGTNAIEVPTLPRPDRINDDCFFLISIVLVEAASTMTAGACVLFDFASFSSIVSGFLAER